MDENKNFNRSEVACALCGKPGVNFSLTDGHAIHKLCVVKLQNNEASINAEIDHINATHRLIERQRGELKAESKSLGGFFKSVFGARNFDDELAALRDAKRDEGLEARIEQNESDLQAVKLQLRKLYDHWPDYPPDWSERREELLRDNDYECEKCGAGQQATLQAHHIDPFWKGGSNKQDNLQLLCVRCHGDTHYRNFEEDGFSEKQTKVSDKEETISEAIEASKKITFMYRKFDEKRGSRRTIEPWGFVDVESGRKSGFTRCIEGHCDLRDEKRRFAVHRMYKVEILD